VKSSIIHEKTQKKSCMSVEEFVYLIQNQANLHNFKGAMSPIFEHLTLANFAQKNMDRNLDGQDYARIEMDCKWHLD
jgi:hypothetical protein